MLLKTSFSGSFATVWRTLSLVTFMSFSVSLSAQTCECTACPINFIDTIQANLTIEVSGAINDDLSDPSQGICGINIDFGHDDIGQLTMELVSPSGQSVQLVGPPSLCGTTLGDIWFISFVPCADVAAPDGGFPAVWDNCSFEGTMLSIFSGSYYPNTGCLEDFDTGPVNGDWTLRFLDDSIRQFGAILDFEIIFCNDRVVSCLTPICQNFEAILPADFYLCEGETMTILEGHNTREMAHRWSTEDGIILSGTQRDSITIGGPGTYTVIVSGPDPESGLICADTADVVVTPSSFSIPSISFNRRFELDCNNDTITVFGVIANTSGNDNIFWTTVDGNIIGPTDGESIVVDEEGIYSIRIENEEGCGGDFEIEVIRNLDEPSVSINGARDINCLFFQSDLNLNSPGSGNTYLWEGPGIDSLLVSQMNQTVTEGGEYSVTVTGDNGCTAEASTTIEIDTTSPTIDIEQSDPWSCFDPIIELSVNSNEALSGYIWTGSDISAPERFQSEVDIDTAGLYYVIVTDRDNGCFAQDSIDILDEREYPTLVSYRDTIRCADTALTLDVNGQGDLLFYEWTGPGITGANRNDSFPVITIPGLYEVDLSVDSNCVVSGQVEIAIDSLRPDVRIVADTFECGDVSATIEAILLQSGITLLWTGPGITSANQNDNIIVTMIPGVFTLTASTSNGCEIVYEVDVTGSGDIPSLVVQNDTLDCNRTSLTLSAISDPEVEYSWTGPGIDAGNENDITPVISEAG